MQTYGPVQPFGRVRNADGTWTIGNSASCEVPCPNPYEHSYTFMFPSEIDYLNGDKFGYVGSPMAYVEGHHDRVGRSGIRLVTVDNASCTDPSGNSLAMSKSTVYPFGQQFPTDQWTVTDPMLPDTLYTLTVSGTDQGINPTQDTFVLDAIYNQTAP